SDGCGGTLVCNSDLACRCVTLKLDNPNGEALTLYRIGDAKTGGDVALGPFQATGQWQCTLLTIGEYEIRGTQTFSGTSTICARNPFFVSGFLDYECHNPTPDVVGGNVCPAQLGGNTVQYCPDLLKPPPPTATCENADYLGSIDKFCTQT